MTDDIRAGLHVAAEQGDEERALAKSALACVVAAAVIVAAGFAGLGRDGMLDPHSPDLREHADARSWSVVDARRATAQHRADHEGDDGKVDGQ
jgi:hypothetical protein